MKSNKVSKKSKMLVLSPFAVLSVTLIATALSFSDGSVENKNLVSNKDNQSRTITDNSNFSSLINPDEAFFVEEDLSTLDVWNSTSNSVNASNKEKFDSLKTNLDKTTGPNTPEKNHLISMVENVQKYIKFRQFEEEYKKANLNDLLEWETAKQAFIDANPGTVEEFASIEDLKNVNELLLLMSGISKENVKANNIRQISNKKIKKTNLTKKTNPSEELNGVSSVAGNGYDNLIQIAEIDLNDQKNFVLEFQYQKSSTTRMARGKLILRNYNNQIKNASNLQEAYSNLDIFGRYDLGSDTLNSGSFNSELENFVLVKESDTLRILARIKSGEILSNIKFSNEPTYGEPKSFGILDVQASDKSTIKSIINRETGDKKLMTNSTNNSTDQIVKIQFFSQMLTTKKSLIKDKNSLEAKRELVFYQGKDQDASFKLNFIARMTGNLYDYELLTKYSNGINTNVPVTLDLPFNVDSPGVSDDKNTYEFFSVLKDKLPVEIKDKFPDIAEIYVSSDVDSSKKSIHQTVTFSEKFYGIGTRPAGWTGVDISNDYSISIEEITDKIFFEKPVSFTNGTKKETTLKALEQIDEKTNVINALGKIYEDWSKNNSLYASQRFGFSTNVVLFNRNGDSFSDIDFKTEDINANGNELYTKFSSYWSNVSDLIKKLFNNDFSENGNRYIVSATNTGSNIVSTWFLGNHEYLSNSNEILEILNRSIEIWKQDPFFKISGNENKVPEFEQLNSDTKLKMSQELSLLVKAQFTAVLNEFNINQLLPMYENFAKAVNSQEIKRRKKIKVNQLVEIIPADAAKNTPQLFKYKDGVYDNPTAIVEEGDFTLVDIIKNIIELFSLGKANPAKDEPLLIDSIINNPTANRTFRNGHIETFITSAPSSAKLQQLQVYDYVLEFFGYSFNRLWTTWLNDPVGEFQLTFDIKDEKGNVKKGGLGDVFDDMISKLLGEQKTHSFIFPTGGKGTSYWLDDIITGANVISSMRWRLNNLSVNSSARLTQARESLVTEREIENRINNILIQQQASGSELSAWSNAVNGSWFFDRLTSDFSGKNGLNEIIDTFNKIVTDKAILAKRINEFTSAALQPLSESLKYVWFVLVALSGVGILTASTFGLISTNKQAKVNSRPVIKVLLVSLIVLGLALTSLSLVFGIIGIL